MRGYTYHLISFTTKYYTRIHTRRIERKQYTNNTTRNRIELIHAKTLPSSKLAFRTEL